jgi:hypothetical protein
VPVSATCTRSTAPKISALSGPNTAVRLLFNTSGSVAVTFSNIGNAPLEYSSSTVSGTLAPNESVTAQVPIYCGWIPGDQNIPFYVNSNDPDLGQQFILITVHCYGDIQIYDFPIAGGSIVVSAPDKDVQGSLDGPGCTNQSNKGVVLAFPSIIFSRNSVETAISHDSNKFPANKFSAPIRDTSLVGRIDDFLSYSTYSTSYSDQVFFNIRAADPGFGACEHFTWPIGLFNSALSAFPGEVDVALDQWKTSVINNSSQAVTLENVKKLVNTQTSLGHNGQTLQCTQNQDYYYDRLVICVIGDVKLSFL